MLESFTDKHDCSHLIVETGTGTGTEIGTGPNDRVASARDPRIALLGLGARTTTTAVQGTAIGNAIATAETDTAAVVEIGTLKEKEDAVVMVAGVVTGEVKDPLDKRPEHLEVVKMTFLLLKGSVQQRRQ